MNQSTFVNILNWYCVERMCLGISSSSRFSSNASKAVRSRDQPICFL